MDMTTFFAIALASGIKSAMPGPCVALTMSRAARGGFFAGLNVTSGVVLANLILASLALMMMMGALIVASETFETIRWLGAGALVWLAYNMLRSHKNSPPKTATSGAFFKDAFAGLVLGLSSPYNLVFLIGILPQFIGPDDLSARGYIWVLAALLAGVQISQIGVTCVGVTLNKVSDRSGHLIEKIGALAMISFAVFAVSAS